MEIPSLAEAISLAGGAAIIFILYKIAEWNRPITARAVTACGLLTPVIVCLFGIGAGSKIVWKSDGGNFEMVTALQKQVENANTQLAALNELVTSEMSALASTTPTDGAPPALNFVAVAEGAPDWAKETGAIKVVPNGSVWEQYFQGVQENEAGKLVAEWGPQGDESKWLAALVAAGGNFQWQYSTGDQTIYGRPIR